MLSFRLVPDQTNIRFLRWRNVAYVVSGIAVLLSLILLPIRGLNYGIDFQGGTLIEVRMPGDAADIATMRTALGGLGLGEVALQEFGQPTDVLIRIERQAGDEAAQLAAVEIVKQGLAEQFEGEISYRRVEFVGPKVSDELLSAGLQAMLYALVAILAYVWFRFEWQFGVGAIVALIHDVMVTLLVFELIGLEFNLSTVAALLTIIGYSLNDTVVIYDRVRENLRRYKAMPMIDLIDQSLNETLARTLMTSLTTLLALLALFVFGGPVIRGFTFAMIWGVLVGTYSTVFIASPLLLPLNLRAENVAPPASQTP
ncbi:MAG: protein translocase subunit SecF [Geminicoccaceae bacterium]|nr:protein translocase subunit SecF [Geminicoccaceae bacterium]